jgi:hypothetical protein
MTTDHDEDLFDYAASEAAKEKALSDVSENNTEWTDIVLAKINTLPQGWSGIGENIRQLCADVGPPKHPNAWGAVINTAVRRGALVPTGRWLRMTGRTSHARQSPEYVKGEMA